MLTCEEEQKILGKKQFMFDKGSRISTKPKPKNPMDSK
jgi:hypothetical protein